MNYAFICFCSSVLLLAIAFAWAFRGVFKTLINTATEHAAVYSAAYVKGACLIYIGAGTTFKEVFQPVTIDQAALFSWWDWYIHFNAPIITGASLLAAFLDKSVQRANEVKAAKLAATNSTPAIPIP